MRDFIEIGATPCDEDCQQLGPSYCPVMAKAECQAFIDQLRRQLGAEPEGARLRIKGFAHEWGTYHEVICMFDDQFPASVAYAFRCESNAPYQWDEAAKKYLEEKRNSLDAMNRSE